MFMDIKTLYFHMHESVVFVDSIMHPNGKPCTLKTTGKPCFLKTRENGVKTSYSLIAISPSSEKDGKKHASKNNKANGTECMSTFHKICSHISNHIWHSYLNKFDAICSPWKRFCNCNNKLWPEAVVIVTWDFVLCIFFVPIDTSLDSWILLSLDFDNSCLLKQSLHAQFPKHSKWQLVDERFICSSRSFGGTNDKVQYSIWHIFTMKPFGSQCVSVRVEYIDWKHIASRHID